MDTLELLTSVRNLTEKPNEGDIGTYELLRYLNMANMYLSTFLMPLFKDDLVVILDESSQTGSYNLPKDILLLVNIYRKNASDVLKFCDRLGIDRKPMIGQVNYPSDDEDHPIVVQNGYNLEFYPALSSTDIRLEYRKRVPELIYGVGDSAGDSTYITLDARGPKRDDIINGSWLALYARDAQGVMQKSDDVLITDYDASTKQAYCATPASDTTYHYALYPTLPDEFHTLLIEKTASYVLKTGGETVKEQVINILELHGKDYNPPAEG